MKTVSEDTLDTLRGEDVTEFNVHITKYDAYIDIYRSITRPGGTYSYIDLVLVEGKEECRKVLAGFLLDPALRKKYTGKDPNGSKLILVGKDKYRSLEVALKALIK